MAQFSFPFDSRLVDGQPDRPFNSEDDRLRYGSLISNGIYPNPSSNLQVMSVGGMDVAVKKGTAWNSGAFYYSNSDTVFTLKPANAMYDRIDSIVLRYDLIKRQVSLEMETGNPSVNPLAPTVIRNDEMYDLQLARIRVPKGVAEISQATIQDMRLDSAMCGLVTGIVKQLDATTLYNQYDVLFQKKEEQFTTDFITWFETIKNKLSDDVAGQLYLMIEEIKTQTDKIEPLEREITGIKSTTNRLTEDVNKLFAGTQIRTGVTFPTASWTKGTDGVYYSDYTYAKIKADDVVNVNLNIGSLRVAKSLLPVTRAFEGYVRIYADEPQTNSLTGDIVIQREVY